MADRNTVLPLLPALVLCYCRDDLTVPPDQSHVATFTSMIQRQAGISCCTARGFPYIHITGVARVRFSSRGRAWRRNAFGSREMD